MARTPELGDLARDERALALFEELSELPEPARSARLAAQCGDDVALRRAVERMLAADRDASRVIASEPPANWSRPERIGPYRLAELIGVGGMGAVYRGERDDGLFEQTVAIKLIRPGVLSASALAQFSSERRILASLQHPHVARLFDGGVDPSGASYIVMEHIAGVSLADWAAEEPRLRERLALFAAVCGAVQFAHQQLVVHADLKPSNVLVTRDGAPKLLDFGIARLIGGDDAHAQLPRALTPRYAAPELAAGEAPRVACDVYSLGVMLAELLGVERADLELPRDIAPRILRDDLAAIVARACAVDPASRYGSVGALREDVERALGDRLVRARVPTLAIRLRKLARRRPWQLAAAVALVVASTVSTTFFLRAERARREADMRFDEVRELAGYQIFVLYDGLQNLPGALALRREVVDRAQRYLERLASSPSAPLEVRLEATAGFGRLAGLQGVPLTPNLGQPQEAHASLRRARAARLRSRGVAAPRRGHDRAGADSRLRSTARDVDGSGARGRRSCGRGGAYAARRGAWRRAIRALVVDRCRATHRRARSARLRPHAERSLRRRPTTSRTARDLAERAARKRGVRERECARTHEVGRWRLLRWRSRRRPRPLPRRR
ncbi:MAG: serine/threonine protein kinase [Deltaproteobacteria bacterium]|nr:serine/threonine protein kinase [Deltaproteobacteria bacterium]